MSKKPEPAQDQPGEKYFGWGEMRYRSDAELDSRMGDFDAQFKRIFGRSREEVASGKPMDDAAPAGESEGASEAGQAGDGKPGDTA